MRTVHPDRWCQRSEGKNMRKRFRRDYMSGGGPGARLWGSFVDAMTELWRNRPLRGPAHPPRDPHTRVYAWAAAWCAALAAANYVALLQRYAVTVSAPGSPLAARRVDFPAVAVCSNNLISRTALREYALRLSARDRNRTYSLQEIESNLLLLGALGAAAHAGAHGYVQTHAHAHFTAFLARAERNLTRLLHELSPRCSSLLVRCSWRAAAARCGQLFAERLTRRGYCCAFNSRYQLADIDTPAWRLDLAGRDYGLGFVVRESSEDYAYTRRAVDGVEVMIWEGSEYPTVEGGNAAVVCARRNTSVLVGVRARVMRADAGLDHLAEERGGCAAGGGGGGARGGYAWCLLRCRVAAVHALCSCTPHAYHALFADESHEVCTLDHLPCLVKHRELFFEYAAARAPAAGGLHCARCKPHCTRTVYATRALHTHFAPDHKLFKNMLSYSPDSSRSISSVNMTEVRVFYTSADQELLDTEPVQRWYEVAAWLGAQCAAVGGVSLVGALQLLYHCARWRHHLQRRRLQHAADRRLWSRLDRRRRR